MYSFSGRLIKEKIKLDKWFEKNNIEKKIIKEYETLKNKDFYNKTNLSKKFKEKYSEETLKNLEKYYLINEIFRIIKKYNLSEKNFNEIILNSKINIFLDYDDLLVDLTSEWIKFISLNINNLNRIIKRKNRNLTYEGYKNYVIDVLKNNKDNLLEEYIKKYKKILSKKIDKKKFLIQNDIEEHILQKMYYGYLNNKKINLMKEDINYYTIYNKIPFSFLFLEKGNIYMDENYENPVVKPFEDSLNFYNFLIESGLIHKTYILTASYPGTEKSKLEHIKRFFPELGKEEKIITTKNKAAVLRFGVLLDDSSKNVSSSVKTNPISMSLLRENITNNNDGILSTKRIRTFKDLNDVFIYLMYSIINIYDRSLNPKYILETIMDNNLNENFNKNIINNLTF